MAMLVGYVYARPIDETAGKAILEAIEPHFLGTVLTRLRSDESSLDDEYRDLIIANDAEFDQPEIYFTWIERGWPYSESGFLWEDRKHCRPPIAVATAADMLADAIEAGDAIAIDICRAANFFFDWELGEIVPECIKAMRDLAKACRFAAEKGAEEVTLFVQG